MIPQEMYVWFTDDNGTWRIRKWDTHPFAEGTKFVNHITVSAIQAIGEPIAWLWQHDETGRTTIREAEQIDLNDRWKKVRPLYDHAPTHCGRPMHRDNIGPGFGFWACGKCGAHTDPKCYQGESNG